MYVNGELQKIANWFRANKMAVNTEKTKIVTFTGSLLMRRNGTSFLTTLL
jgi:hypothetical protein